MKKRIVVLFLTVIMLAGLLSGMAMAAEGSSVGYVERSWNAANKAVTTAEKTAESCTPVEASSSAVTWETGWYVVNSDVTVSGRITVNGDVKLILADGFTLTASEGVGVNTGKSLTVYGQTNGTGALVATAVDTDHAGIGGTDTNAGSITIHGGSVTATGGSWGAGIGGGGYRGNGGEITIFGGTVNATGKSGIGGGYYGDGGSITIYGGTVTAAGKGSADGPGIGGGEWSSAGTIKIYGGTVTATGGSYGAGIGTAYYGEDGTVTVYGGTVNATGGYGGAGIGEGWNNTGTVKILLLGGTITAQKGDAAEENVGKGRSSEGTPAIFDLVVDNRVSGSYMLTDDVTVPSGKTLTIQEDATLIVASGTTLTNSGTVVINGTVVKETGGEIICQNGHIYTSDCDEVCNLCFAERTPASAHDYSGCDYDATNHWDKCVCGDTANVTDHSYFNGFCTKNGCGSYEPATLNNNGTTDDATDDYYEISNGGQLFWFANQVNVGNTAINGKLTADIDLNPGYTFNSDGTVTKGEETVDSGWHVWKPISPGSDMKYTGVFSGKKADGGNYTISGVYINADADYSGFFGYVGANGKIENVTLSNGYLVTKVNGIDYIGGICGYLYNGSIMNCSNGISVCTTGSSYVGGILGSMSGGSVVNCTNHASVTGTVLYIGGIVGQLSSGTVDGCANFGAITNTYNWMGGIAGVNYGSITNCANFGKLTGGNWVGGITGENKNSASITNCYNIGIVSGYSYIGRLIGRGNDFSIINSYYQADASVTGSLGVHKTEAQFASGEVAFLLNGDQTTILWGQDIKSGEDDTEFDSYPVLGGSRVYRGYDGCRGVYSNSVLSNTTQAAHTYANGICSGCGEIQAAVLNDNGTAEDTADDYYEIGNAGQLIWFEQKVNNGNPAINGKLVADIDLNPGYTFNSDGTVTKGEETVNSGWYIWKTICPTSDVRYTGIFSGKKADDGNYTISGVYINADADYSGFFGYVGANGKIENVTLSNGYLVTKVSGIDYIGGICGELYNGSIMNCSNGISIYAMGSMDVGGIVGQLSSGTVDGCANFGAITNTYNWMGGIAGINNGSITNCANFGKLTGGNWVGGIAGQNNSSGSITNCYDAGTASGGIHIGRLVGSGNASGVINSYYQADEAVTDSLGINKTEAQFASGEVAYLLSAQSDPAVWGQDLDNSDNAVDFYPVLGAAKVYKGYDRCKVGYSNDANISQTPSDHSYANGICAVCNEAIVSSVTLDPNGAAAGSTTSVTATGGEALPDITGQGALPEKENNVFLGYYDSRTGGTKYYNLDGTSAKKWDKNDAAVTLYAQWHEKTTLTAADFAFTPPLDTVYDGSKKEVTVSGPDEAGKITVKYYKDNQLLSGVPADAGAYTVKIDMVDNDYYYGITDLTDDAWTFTIAAKTLQPEEVTVSGLEESYTYTGSAIKPNITVKVGNRTFIKGTDYDVTYGNNTNVADGGSVTVTFKGNYTSDSPITKSWAITKATQSAPELPVITAFTSSRVELKPITTSGHGDIQYAVTTGAVPEESAWQASPVFGNLTKNTDYVFYARYAGDENYEPSSASYGAAVTTLDVFTVTFKDHDGEPLKEESVDQFAAATAPADPTREGYTFAGWDKGFDKVTEALTVTAQYQVNKHDIVYMVDGEEYERIKDVAYGTEIAPITAPTKTGYTFSGWSDMPATMPDEAVTVVGNFTVNKHDIIYMVDGAEYERIEDVAYGTEITVITEPAKTGHNFSGWSVMPVTMPDEDVTVTGTFIAKQYAITVTESGSQGGAPYLWYGEVTYGKAHTNYVVKGKEDAWYCDVVKVTVDGTELISGTDYTYNISSGTLTINADKVTGGIEVFARVNAKVTFDLNGGDLAEANKAELTSAGIAIQDGKFTIPMTYGVPSSFGTTLDALKEVFIRTGYTFTGFKNGEQDAQLEAALVNCQLTAQWQVNQYTIDFVTSGGTAIAQIKQDYGTKVSAPETTREGYGFGGWYKDEALKEAYVFTEDTTIGAENITLYAKWNPLDGTEYTVKHNFEKLDGSFETQSEPLSGKTEEDTAAQAKTVEGFTAGAVTQQQIKGDGTTVIEISYTRNSHTVTFKPENGKEAVVSTLKFGAAITKPADPEKAGHTFAGWGNVAATMPDEDVTYTAKWNVNKYTIEWDTDGDGTVDKSDTVEYGKTPTAPTASKANVGCTKYIFSKWDKAIEAVTGDETYTAVFTEGVAHTGKNHTENVKKATCKEEGYTGDTVCECGTIVKKGEAIPKLTTHTWGDWNTTKEPTETLAGEKSRTCAVCGKIEKETVPALGVSGSGECKQNETCPIHPFVDAKVSAWYHDGVHFCLETGLMNGTGEKTFDPNGDASRAMIVTILWRQEGSPTVAYDMTFEDVPADKWYTEAVRWAASEGIVTGYNDKEFGPNDSVTREQLATILSRYCQVKGYQLPADKGTGFDAFSDVSSVSTWAKNGMKWAFTTGLIQGATKDGKVVLAALDDASRAQVATVLYRFNLATVGEE